MSMSGWPRLTKAECAAEALKHNSRGAFFRRSKRCYNGALKHGWVDEICAHMTGNKTIWTEERIREEALKHRTLSDWKKAAIHCYRKARKLGIAEECMAHMEPRKRMKPPGHWTEERIKAEALKYSTSSDFKKGSPGAYDAARYKGMEPTLLVQQKDPTKILKKIKREIGSIRRVRGTAQKIQFSSKTESNATALQETAWMYDQVAYEREDRLLQNIESLKLAGRDDLVSEAWRLFAEHQASWYGNSISV